MVRGQRAIAAAVGLHQEIALLCLRELSGRGHITIEGVGRERRRYLLEHPVYWQKERKPASKVA